METIPPHVLDAVKTIEKFMSDEQSNDKDKLRSSGSVSDLVRLVLLSSLSPVERLVLIAVFMENRKMERTFVLPIGDLVPLTGLSDRHIRACMSKFRKLGILESQREPTNGRVGSGPNRYRVNLKAIP